MRRIVSVFILALALFTSYMVIPQSGEGRSCHGNCIDRLSSAAQCAIGQEQGKATATILGSAQSSKNPDSAICLIDVVVTGGADPHSFIDPGQSAVFSVQQGLIVFTVDQGLVRVFPSGNDGEDISNLEQIGDNVYQNKDNAPFTLAIGASVSLDVSDDGVEITYINTPAEEPADMLIAVVPVPENLEGTPEASPSPQS